MLEAKTYVLDWLLAEYLGQANYTEAENVLLEENTKQAKQEVLGLKVLHQDWTGFANALNTYPIENQDDDWFVQVQNINLQRLTATFPFVLTSQQESFLYQVALSFSPARGYARGLLALLKDERLDDPDPEEEQPKEELSSVKEEASIYKIYPNPAYGEVTVKYPDFAVGASLALYDRFGRQVRTNLLSNVGSITLKVSDLPDGVYVVRIARPDEVLFLSKLIIFR
ncbi:MAG: hypothetical protein OHK0019_15640 [Saprospiraceae bacterium]